MTDSVTSDLWVEKATLALEAARQSLDAGNLPAAANRGYFALYAAVTAALMKAGQMPPERGNWAHARLPIAVRQHVRGPFHARRLAIMLLDRLYKLRLLADYGNHRRLDADELGAVLRQLGAVVRSSQEDA